MHVYVKICNWHKQLKELTYLPTEPEIVSNDGVVVPRQVVGFAAVAAAVGSGTRDPHDSQHIHAIEKYYDTQNVVAATGYPKETFRFSLYFHSSVVLEWTTSIFKNKTKVSKLAGHENKLKVDKYNSSALISSILLSTNIYE